jgi:hypothetical protein
MQELHIIPISLSSRSSSSFRILYTRESDVTWLCLKLQEKKIGEHQL